jgi:hypothetical protein
MDKLLKRVYTFSDLPVEPFHKLPTLIGPLIEDI